MQWEYPRLLVFSEKLPLYCFQFNHRLELYIFHCNRHHYILQITHFYILQLLITIFQNNVIRCWKVDRDCDGDVDVTGWQPCVILGLSSGCLVGNAQQHNGHCWLRQTLLSSQWNLQMCIQVFHSGSTCKYNYNIKTEICKYVVSYKCLCFHGGYCSDDILVSYCTVQDNMFHRKGASYICRATEVVSCGC